MAAPPRSEGRRKQVRFAERELPAIHSCAFRVFAHTRHALNLRVAHRKRHPALQQNRRLARHPVHPQHFLPWGISLNAVHAGYPING
jgi:hypothetical protein